MGDIIDMEMSSKTRAEEEPSSEPPSVIPELPEDVIVDILARVPRFDYPTLSLVSKHFRSLVSSPEIYARRSLLGCTEHCLYVVLYNFDNSVDRWYILHRKANGNSRLVLVPLLPSLSWGKSFVVLGSRIYVFGTVNYYNLSALSIDCRSRRVKLLPNMRIPTGYTDADIIDGRIYAIGNVHSNKKVMVVFNTETQTWEPGMIELDTEQLGYMWLGFVVMAGKIYMRNSENSFVYEPEENKWKMDEKLNLEKWKDACVVDEVLYYYDDWLDSIRTYDPKQRCWGVLKGVEEFLKERSRCPYIQMVSYGGRLAFCFRESRKIWCAEISLERRQGGEIWGKVGWCDHVLTGNFSITKPLDVMV